MIPIADNLPTRIRPIATYFLIGLNIGLFLWELKLEIIGDLTTVLYRWGVVPARITEVAADAIAQHNPAAWVALIFMSSASLIVGLFFHGSFSQILGNLLFLFVFGQQVENKLGHGRFVAFYLMCGVLSFVVQILVEPTLNAPLVGANGAIAGILGAYLLKFPKSKIETILPLAVVFLPIELPVWFYLFWWFIQQVFYGVGQLNVTGGVNPMTLGYWAHSVGLLIGAGLMVIMAKPPAFALADSSLTEKIKSE